MPMNREQADMRGAEPMPSTGKQKAVLAALAAIDVAAAVWMVAGDVGSAAASRGLAMDGAMVAIAVAYVVALAAINAACIMWMGRLTASPQAAMDASRKPVLNTAEMTLLVGLLSVLVGFLMMNPGTAVWLVLVAIALVFVGGVVATAGLALLVVRWAVRACAPKRRPAGRRPADGGSR